MRTIRFLTTAGLSAVLVVPVGFAVERAPIAFAGATSTIFGPQGHEAFGEHILVSGDKVVVVDSGFDIRAIPTLARRLSTVRVDLW